MCNCHTVWIEKGEEVYKRCNNPTIGGGTCFYHQGVAEGRFAPSDDDDERQGKPIRVERGGEVLWKA